MVFVKHEISKTRFHFNVIFNIQIWLQQSLEMKNVFEKMAINYVFFRKHLFTSNKQYMFGPYIENEISVHYTNVLSTTRK